MTNERLTVVYHILGVVVAIYTLTLLLGEIIIYRLKGLPVDHRDCLLSNLSGLIAVVTQGGFKAAVAMPLMFFCYYRTPLDMKLGAAAWALSFFLATFIQWLNHYLYHKVRLFWCFHAVHHSSEVMRFSTGIRTSVLDVFSLDVLFLIIPLLGIHPLIYYSWYGLFKIWGLFLHIDDKLVGDLKFIRRILVTPRFHAVHHGRNPQYIDKNFGEVIPLYDRLFHTYQSMDEAPDYGLADKVSERDLIRLQMREVKALWRDIRSTRIWRNKLRYVFAAPGWVP